ncbi:TrbC/VirB2 family protein [Novosphingopyxis sp.]|uniref:TrbC/VirB2 family protein n=1 Tax=Novosphingopyxis sp. TaxID=2709690 RepID=UPI003B59760A
MQPSLFDPSGSNAVVEAALWVQRLLLGSLATSIAVIAVAWLGFMMLQGSVSIRRGTQLLAGCFILFGAASIAQGLAGLAQREGGREAIAADYRPAATVSPQATELAPYDPYAGASVPVR